MPHFTTERRVRHSADEMFSLVADVERYPEFVPLCEKLVVRGRQKEGEREILVADMTVAYKLIRESFTSRVVLDRPALAIRVDYLSGPFHHLKNDWTFVAVSEEASIIRFAIDYEFRSRMLSVLMGSVFDKAFRKFAEAFEERADAVYGVGAV
ncbi:type II toxin-antitoxin system RatA family toxin [Prosthecomicrobium pneumaticum]|uniref:Coenzyme Q-binding protein COQ10 n=1 Tax=Prosthecomicrobium pneumaticum TaxID=81895 RepID=A0A7W9CT82_9HYPH|nr:type II toxin-antitoxin system RatA family toxin [Prosthecomicrobium pneumaticum]MBB5751216.1 coenzyme Q-binding protein COQ10 [Prosthecomicrobium pneumaticum]